MLVVFLYTVVSYLWKNVDAQKRNEKKKKKFL